jgi:hypothetical protein
MGIYLSGNVSNWDLIRAFNNYAGVYIGGSAILSSNIIVKNNQNAGFQISGVCKVLDVIGNNNASGVNLSSSSLGATKITSASYNGTGVMLNGSSPYIVIDEIVDANFNTTGIQFGGAHTTVTLVRRLNNNATGLYFTGYNNVLKEVSQVNNSTVVVLQLSIPQTSKILKITGDQNKALISGTAGDSWFYIYNGAFTNTNVATNKILIYSGMLYLINWNTALVASDIYIGAAYFYNSRIVFHALNTRDNHISYCDYGIIKSDATERHSLTGISWKFSPSNLARDIKYPLDLSIAKVVCVAGKTTQVAIWVKKSHATDVGGRLVIIGGKVPGIGTPTQNVFVEAVNVTDWQQISMSFTPTYTEVVEIEFWAYWQANAATQSIWIDDISIV